MKNKINYALITGATSGIGKEMAIYLDELGYQIIAVARNSKMLDELKTQLVNKSIVLALDLSDMENVKKLYEIVKGYGISILVNNAGVGCYGNFLETRFEDEINMINLNIIASHLLMKNILKDMIKKNSGYILNVASSSVFVPAGPFMSSYYATKSYIYTLTNSVIQELKETDSKVVVSLLCPGPVNTKFNEKMNIDFSVKSMDSKYVAKYAIDNMLKGKNIIVPGAKIKFVKNVSKFMPSRFVNKINYNIQKSKKNNKLS